MRRVPSLLLATIVLGAVACAPEPGGMASPSTDAEPSSTEPTASAPESATAGLPEPSTEPSVTAPVVTDTPTATASDEPSASDDASSSPGDGATSGWRAIDETLTEQSQALTLGLTDAAAHYLGSRLGEPCDLQFVVYAAHEDGYFVADESGICNGQVLGVYGPQGDEVAPLLEISSVPPCAALAEAGVPKGVPVTERFPDGLACTDGSTVTKY